MWNLILKTEHINDYEILGSHDGEYEHSRLLMEALGTYETSIKFYQSTRHKPEDSRLQTDCV